MPLEKQNVEVVLGGLEQKTDHKTVVPGRLERAVNVEYDKGGSMNKRRGYQRVIIGDNIAPAIQGNDIYNKLAIYRDELVVFAIDELYALADRNEMIGSSGQAFIRRGPISRGTVRVQIAFVASTSEEVP